MSNFFALLSRMKYIDRWALMRSARKETLSEHTLEVAMLSHALAVIGNTYLGKHYDAAACALAAIYHDAPEIITGDMPTPVKYNNKTLSAAYKELEKETEKKLLSMLPDEMRESFIALLSPVSDEVRKIVKAADKLCAYLKCVEEYRNGNKEFKKALESSRKIVKELGENVPEVKWFMDNVAESYEKSIDEL